MKKKLIPLTLLCLPLSAQDDFRDLKIGGSLSGVNENIASGYSLASGIGHKASYRSVALGLKNDVHFYGFANGVLNDVGAIGFANGYYNDVNGGSGQTWNRGSFATGWYNSISGRRSNAIGWDNVVVGHDITAIGTGLIGSYNQALIVGKFNEDKQNLLFSIGNGTSDFDYTQTNTTPYPRTNISRSNAFEVYNDGSIKIPGDLEVAGSPVVTMSNLELQLSSLGRLEADSIIISSGTPNIFSGLFKDSMIIGNNNEAYGSDTLIVGSSNELTSGSGGAGTGENQIIFGNQNTGGGISDTFVSGSNNDLGHHTVNNHIVGSYNDIDTENAFVAGTSNTVTGNFSRTMGNGLNNSGFAMITLGVFNKTEGTSSTTLGDDSPLLVVGNGTSSTEDSRSDALIINRNGDIIIPKVQGDISMGIYAPSN